MTMTLNQIDRERLTPMLRQYLGEKDRFPDSLLFFRMGDFYELFFDDAVTASRELELTLTARDCGLKERAPMCGVPHHAADGYIHRLLSKGYKVAVCDQVEDPATAKGLVRREVVRIVTPGTVTDPNHLESGSYSFLVSVVVDGVRFGLAACDLASGHFETTTIGAENSASRLEDELTRLTPRELVINEALQQAPFFRRWLEHHEVTVNVLPDLAFSEKAAQEKGLHFGKEYDLWAGASAALLNYIEETQKDQPVHIGAIAPYEPQRYMLIDRSARQNLELTETLRGRARKGSLIGAIDRTKTSMGSRLLRSWLLQPLLNRRDILARQSVVALFHEKYELRQDLRGRLTGLFDLERLLSRLALKRVNARDLSALKDVLQRLPGLRERLQAHAVLEELRGAIDPLPDLCQTLEAALVDEPPPALREGGMIREGYSQEADHLRDAFQNGRRWLLELEEKERQASGIRNLKVGYNRVFGYYFEVTRANYDLVPDHFVRKQTLVNSERFFTEELKELEETVLGAEAKLVELEYELFIDLREQVLARLAALRTTAWALARLDVFSALAELAARENYVAPEIAEDRLIQISEGRHPVVEQQRRSEGFVANDVRLDDDKRRLLLVTGPNMSGKSTYMRQTALIVLLAQMGSFVPATSAHIGLVDRIFTRVGASDDVASGQSTFMVEMTEVASILRQATAASLIILDEVGRGTSTFDGLAIAWAVLEHIVNRQRLGSRTLFATHYHELTELENSLDGVTNAHVAVQEQDGEIVFLHRIREGGSDDSYGVDVAKLAGVPDAVVTRARDILLQLERDNRGRKLTLKRHKQQMEGQIDLFSAAASLRADDRLIRRIRDSDLDRLRPLDALSLLVELQAEIKEREKPHDQD